MMSGGDRLPWGDRGLSKKNRILVADDEERIRMLLEAHLAAFGYDVELACDGSQALEKLKSGDFNAVITDMNMPGASGLEVILEARRQYGPYLPVIVITAYGSVQNAVEAMRDGATDYLEKPFDMGDLRACLEKWLEEDSKQKGNTSSGNEGIG